MSSKIFEDVIKYIPSTTMDMLTDELYSHNIMLNIDTALGILVQNGIGKHISLVDNKDYTWDDFFTEEQSIRSRSYTKQFVYTQVQLIFDTPAPSVVQILEKSAQESLWRARLEGEDIEDK